jgi:hypothetical protein
MSILDDISVIGTMLKDILIRSATQGEPTFVGAETKDGGTDREELQNVQIQ